MRAITRSPARARCRPSSRTRSISDPLDSRLRAAILDLLARRGAEKSICPSEAARQVAGEAGAWRGLMDRTRAVAAHLVAEGRIEATQKGAPVDIASARGQIRLRLPRR